jgi:Family of unknown function (DUF6166)
VSDELREYWRDVRAPPHERTYTGFRDLKAGKCKVSVTVGSGRPAPLKMCLNVMKHSPTGFEWGYPGSGPAQLALAILVDAIGRTKAEKERALRLHQRFKAAVVVKLPHEKWMLTRSQVLDLVARLEGGKRGS